MSNNIDSGSVEKVLQIKADIKKSRDQHLELSISREEAELKRTLEDWEMEKLAVKSERYAIALVMAIELKNLRDELLKDLREEFLNTVLEEGEKHIPNVQKMHIKKTQRGFDLIEFVDHYGAACSLQKSSLATEDCIWLGTNTNRMHLTQEQISQLLPHLHEFVEAGNICYYPGDEVFGDDDGGDE